MSTTIDPPASLPPNVPVAVTVLGELAIFDTYLKSNGMAGIFGFLSHMLTTIHGIPAPILPKAEEIMSVLQTGTGLAEQFMPQAAGADMAVRAAANAPVWPAFTPAEPIKPL
jgi:hypothetical protein